jgi:N-acetylglucosaminyldiphosphoundecaprenol N-acetyl-beta-D-mannosaminyltransferase
MSAEWDRPEFGAVRFRLAGTVVDACTREYVMGQVEARLLTGEGAALLIGSANVQHFREFSLISGRHGIFVHRDEATWLLLPDGVPVVRLLRRMTGVKWEQLAGSDLLPEFLAIAERLSVRVGFFGGTSMMHAGLGHVLSNCFHGLELAGMWAPERQRLLDPTGAASLADEVRRASVDLLVVSLGKPRQEQWLATYAGRAGIKVGLAFGAATDFVAGTIPRAPTVLREHGLEWLFRLALEPRRLARRYVLEGPVDIVRMVKSARLD